MSAFECLGMAVLHTKSMHPLPSQGWHLLLAPTSEFHQYWHKSQYHFPLCSSVNPLWSFCGPSLELCGHSVGLS